MGLYDKITNLQPNGKIKEYSPARRKVYAEGYNAARQEAAELALEVEEAEGSLEDALGVLDALVADFLSRGTEEEIVIREQSYALKRAKNLLGKTF